MSETVHQVTDTLIRAYPQLSPDTVRTVVGQAERELVDSGCCPPADLPERVDRLARIRLADTPQPRVPRGGADGVANPDRPRLD